MPGIPTTVMPAHSDSVYRSLQGSAMGRIGAGFLCKPQVTGTEYRDYHAPTYSLVAARGWWRRQPDDGRSAPGDRPHHRHRAGQRGLMIGPC
ncbi:MAG: hypothetical protein ACOCZK_08155, partial [Planctomycetota bacterium]